MTKRETRLSLHQQHGAAAFDLAGDFTVEVGRHACDTAGENFAALGHEFFQKIGIFIIDCFGRDIDATARHGPIGAAEGRATFSGLWLHAMRSTRLAVKRMFF